MDAHVDRVRVDDRLTDSTDYAYAAVTTGRTIFTAGASPLGVDGNALAPSPAAPPEIFAALLANAGDQRGLWGRPGAIRFSADPRRIPGERAPPIRSRTRHNALHTRGPPS